MATPGERLTSVEAWIKNIGDRLQADVEGLKRAIWVFSGGAGVIGVVIGLLGPYLLKKLGFS